MRLRLRSRTRTNAAGEPLRFRSLTAAGPSTKERERLAEQGEAMKDGSFPIRNVEDLRNAIQSVGRAKDYDAAKRWIMKRARELDAEDELPEDWTKDTSAAGVPGPVLYAQMSETQAQDNARYAEELCPGCGTLLGEADALCAACGHRREALTAAFDESKVARHPKGTKVAGKVGGGRFAVKTNAAGRHEVVSPEGKKVAETTEREDAEKVASEKNAAYGLDGGSRMPPERLMALTIAQADEMLANGTLGQADYEAFRHVWAKQSPYGEESANVRGWLATPTDPAVLDRVQALDAYVGQRDAGERVSVKIGGETYTGQPETLTVVENAIEGPHTYPSGWEGRYDPVEGRYIGMDDIYMPADFDPTRDAGSAIVQPGVSSYDRLTTHMGAEAPAVLRHVTDPALREKITRVVETTGPQPGGGYRSVEELTLDSPEQERELSDAYRSALAETPADASPMDRGPLERAVGKMESGEWGFRESEADFTPAIAKADRATQDAYRQEIAKIREGRGGPGTILEPGHRRLAEERAFARADATTTVESQSVDPHSDPVSRLRIVAKDARAQGLTDLADRLEKRADYLDPMRSAVARLRKWGPDAQREETTVVENALTTIRQPGSTPADKMLRIAGYANRPETSRAYGGGLADYSDGELEDALDSAGLTPEGSARIVRELAARGVERPVSIVSSAVCGEREELEALVAAIPVKPPADWFELPKLDGPTPMTVTDDGRIFGHAAVWGTCHLGNPRGAGVCVQPPRSQSAYGLFHLGEVETDAGSRVPVGQITLDTGHAPLGASARNAASHYDHTGTCAADVVVGEDEHGIVFAGALRPDMTPERARTLMGSKISGDWRGGELVGLLAVNVPGFPVPRARLVASADGVDEVMALVAAGVVTDPFEGLRPEAVVEILAARAEGVEALAELAGA